MNEELEIKKRIKERKEKINEEIEENLRHHPVDLETVRHKIHELRMIEKEEKINQISLNCLTARHQSKKYLD